MKKYYKVEAYDNTSRYPLKFAYEDKAEAENVFRKLVKINHMEKYVLEPDEDEPENMEAQYITNDKKHMLRINLWPQWMPEIDDITKENSMWHYAPAA